MNDGGKLVPLRNERKRVFQDFIAASNGDRDDERSVNQLSHPGLSGTAAGTSCRSDSDSDSERGGHPSDSAEECVSAARAVSSAEEDREEEQGVFSSFTIGESPTRVKVLLLDTRYHRDSHWLRSLGEVKWLPLSALVAAALRVVTTFLDVGGSRVHDGDMLGEKQWNW